MSRVVTYIFLVAKTSKFLAIFINFALPVKDEDVTSAFAGGVVKSSRFFDWLFYFHTQNIFVNLQCLEDVRMKWLSPALHFPDFFMPILAMRLFYNFALPRASCAISLFI